MGGKALEQAAQGNCGCPILGIVQGQTGWCFEHPGLVGSVPAPGVVGVELDDLTGPFQPRRFCDSNISVKCSLVKHF